MFSRRQPNLCPDGLITYAHWFCGGVANILRALWHTYVSFWEINRQAHHYETCAKLAHWISDSTGDSIGTLDQHPWTKSESMAGIVKRRLAFNAQVCTFLILPRISNLSNLDSSVLGRVSSTPAIIGMTSFLSSQTSSFYYFIFTFHYILCDKDTSVNFKKVTILGVI